MVGWLDVDILGIQGTLVVYPLVDRSGLVLGALLQEYMGYRDMVVGVTLELHPEPYMDRTLCM